MTNSYYKTSADYHDALDRMEARERAERAEAELRKSESCPLCDGTGYKRISPTILATCDHSEPEQCVCLEYAGDDPKCPVHGWMNEQEGSDTSTMTQLNDAGYGCGGIY